MSDLSNDKQLDVSALFARVADGQASEEEVRALDELLCRDSHARQLWWEFVSVESGAMQYLQGDAPLVDLQRAMAEGKAAPAVKTSHRSQPSSLAKMVASLDHFARRHPVISCSVAALFIGVILSTLAILPRPGFLQQRADAGATAPKFVAKLVGTHDAQWSGVQVGTTHGARLQAGHRYRLARGFAEFQLDRGARVILEGPAELVIDNNNRVQLVHGRLAAKVPPSAPGFQIDTPQGKVVDLGTELGVSVADDGELHVECFQGRITYTPTAGEMIDISAGQGVARVNRAGEIRRTTSNATQFVRNLRLKGRLQSDATGLIVDERFSRNVAQGATVGQSTTHSPQFPAEFAVDGDPTNFTHTAMSDLQPALTIDLGQPYDIDAVVVHNRDECCGVRLRDITVEILSSDGAEVMFTSELLNADGTQGSPEYLTVGLPEQAGAVVRGRYVRIRRQIMTGDSTNIDQLGDQRVLSVGEVQVFAEPVLKISPPVGVAE